MNMQRTLKHLAISVCILACAVLNVANAVESVKIKEVDVDLSTGTVTIFGTGFDTPNDTIVELGMFGSLDIVSETESEIVASLPVDIGPGNYLLSVTVRRGSSQKDEFDLSISARPKLHVTSFNAELGLAIITQAQYAEPMPGMAITVDIPPGENRMLLITFSAVSTCTQIPLDTDIKPYCLVIPNIPVRTPANSYSITSDEYGVQSANSFQWIAGPFGPGSVNVQMEWAASYFGPGAKPSFIISQATMSILTFPESDTTEDFYFIPE